MSNYNSTHLAYHFLNNKGKQLNVKTRNNVVADNYNSMTDLQTLYPPSHKFVDINTKLSEEDKRKFELFFEMIGEQNNPNRINFMRHRKVPDISVEKINNKVISKYRQQAKADGMKKSDTRLCKSKPFGYVNSNQKTLESINNKVAVSRKFLCDLTKFMIKDNKIRCLGNSVLYRYCLLTAAASVGKKIEKYISNSDNGVSKVSKKDSYYVRLNLDRGKVELRFRDPRNKYFVDRLRENDIKSLSAAEIFNVKTEKESREIVKKLLEYDLIQICSKGRKTINLDTCDKVVVKIVDYDNKGKGRGYMNRGYVLITKEAQKKCLMGGKVSEIDAFLDMMFNTVTVDSCIKLSNYIPVTCYKEMNVEKGEEVSPYTTIRELEMRWGMSRAPVFNRLQKWVNNGLISYYVPPNNMGIIITPANFCNYFLGVTEPILPGESAITRLMWNFKNPASKCQKYLFKLYSVNPCSDNYFEKFNTIDSFDSIDSGKYHVLIGRNMEYMEDDYSISLDDLLCYAIEKEKIMIMKQGNINLRCKKLPGEFTFDVYMSLSENQTDFKYDKLMQDKDNGCIIRLHSDCIELLQKEILYSDLTASIANWSYKKFYKYFPSFNIQSHAAHLGAQMIDSTGRLDEELFRKVVTKACKVMTDQEYNDFFYKPVPYEEFAKAQGTL